MKEPLHWWEQNPNMPHFRGVVFGAPTALKKMSGRRLSRTWDRFVWIRRLHDIEGDGQRRFPCTEVCWVVSRPREGCARVYAAVLL